MAVLSLPCIFGFNLWKAFEPFEKGTSVLDLEDFIVSDNLLPLGSFLIVLFCTWPQGWGADASYAEINTGNGLKLPRWTIHYCCVILPAIIFALWLIGLCRKFDLVQF